MDIEDTNQECNNLNTENKKKDVSENVPENTAENLFTQKNKLKMRDLIDNLSRDGKIEILKIIIKNEEKFNENNNGVLFDLSKMNQSTLQDINDFLKFTINNKKELNKTENLINNYKDYFN